MVPGSVLAMEAYTVDAYDIQMDVRKDNSYEIVETIDVTFLESRHGIIRSIPLMTYRGDWAEIDRVSVLGYPYRVSEEGGDLLITIGDAESYANTNEKYVISYTYTIGDDGLGNMDELYFNLIGTDWDARIDQVTFAISMPASFDSANLNFTVGEAGSVDNSKVYYSVDGAVIRGGTKESLGPGEALTVALPLPEGYFTAVQNEAGFAEIFAGYYWLILPVFLLLGFVAWVLWGRNRKIFPTVEFYPPLGATPADIGYIMDGKVDPFDITALIIYWADRQYLTITEVNNKILFINKKSFMLEKIRDMGGEAKEYERVMFNALFDEFGNGRQVSTTALENRFYLVFRQIKGMVSQSIQRDPKTRIYEKSGFWVRLLIDGFALAALWCAMFTLYGKVTHETVLMQSLMGLIAAVLLLIPMWLLLDLIRRWKMMQLRKRVLGVVLIGILNLIEFFIVLYFGVEYDLLLPILFAQLIAFLVLVFSVLSRKRTKLGDWYLERLFGVCAPFSRRPKVKGSMPWLMKTRSIFIMCCPMQWSWGSRINGRVILRSITEPPHWYYSDRRMDVFSTTVLSMV